MFANQARVGIFDKVEAKNNKKTYTPLNVVKTLGWENLALGDLQWHAYSYGHPHWRSIGASQPGHWPHGLLWTVRKPGKPF